MEQLNPPMTRIRWGHRTMIVTVAVIVTTLVLPWWSVAIVGLLFGLAGTAPWRALEAGLGAMLGWGALLALAAIQGPVGVLAVRLGGLFHLPGTVLLVVTILFAGALGWGGAGVGRALSHKP